MSRNISEVIDDAHRLKSRVGVLSDERDKLEAIKNRSPGQDERLANVNAGLLRLTKDAKSLESETEQIMANMDPDALESGDGAAPLRPTPSMSRARGSRSGVLASALEAANFDLRTRPHVSLPAREFYAAWTWPATADFPSLVSPDVAGKVADRRYVHPFLPQEDLGDSLSIQDFKQTVETVTGTIERDPAATGTKATYDGTVTSVTDAVKQVALVAPDIPAAVVNALPAFGSWLDTELSQQIGRAVDKHVVDQVVAAVPGITNVGTDPLPDAVRKAVTAMRNAGANPSLLVANPAQSEALDLLRTADGIYIRGMTSTNTGPLWDLTVVETPSVATLGASAGPLVLDPGLLGVLFKGPTEFKADPFTNMRSNLVDFLLELNLLMHVRNIVGARQIRN